MCWMAYILTWVMEDAIFVGGRILLLDVVAARKFHIAAEIIKGSIGRPTNMIVNRIKKRILETH